MSSESFNLTSSPSSKIGKVEKLLEAIRHIHGEDEANPSFRGDLGMADSLILEVIESLKQDKS